MPYNKYLQITRERYDVMHDNYRRFVESIEDVTKEPVRIFDPLSPQHIKELLLIREVSKELQLKRDEDLKKAEQQAAEAEAKAKEVAAQAAEEATENTPVEA